MKAKRINRNIVILILILVTALIMLLLIVYQDISRGSAKAAEDKFNFEVWTIYGDSEHILDEAIAKYRTNHPETNVEYKVTVYKNEVYQSAIESAILNDTVPDMFFYWGYEKIRNLAEAGLLYELSDALERQPSTYFMLPSVAAGFKIDDKVYALPLYGWKATLFCNREMFHKYHLEYPKTNEELNEVITCFQKNGITPFSCGMKELWLPSLFYLSFVLQETSVDEVLKLADNMEYFQQPAFVHAADKMEQLILRAPWQEQFYSYDSYYAAFSFLQENTAMFLGGSWTSREIEASNIKDKVDAIAFPNDGTKQGVGGYADTFVINKNGKLAEKDEYIDMYVELMRYMSDISVEKYGVGLPAYTKQKLSSDSIIMNQCAQIDYSAGMHPAYDQVLHANEADTFYSELSNFLLGQITSGRFLQILAFYQEKPKAESSQ